MWDLPGPGIEPVSPALAGGFSTTALQGKPASYSYTQIIFEDDCLISFSDSSFNFSITQVHGMHY